MTDVYSMWVAPSARGQGIGRSLIETACEWAIRSNVVRLVLYVTSGNEPAKRLYTAAGFVATGQREPLRPGSRLLMDMMIKRPS